jgi:hypothetical protein
LTRERLAEEEADREALAREREAAEKRRQHDWLSGDNPGVWNRVW